MPAPRIRVLFHFAIYVLFAVVLLCTSFSIYPSISRISQNAVAWLEGTTHSLINLGKSSAFIAFGLKLLGITIPSVQTVAASKFITLGIVAAYTNPLIAAAFTALVTPATYLCWYGGP